MLRKLRLGRVRVLGFTMSFVVLEYGRLIVWFGSLAFPVVKF